MAVFCCRCYAFVSSEVVVAIRWGHGVLSFAVGVKHQTLPCSLFIIIMLSSESSPLACIRYASALFMGSLRLSALHHFRILFLVLLLLCSSFPFFCRFYRVFGRYILSLEFCRCPSDIFLPSKPRTLLVPDWQPRTILLDMIEARLKKNEIIVASVLLCGTLNSSFLGTTFLSDNEITTRSTVSFGAYFS